MKATELAELILSRLYDCAEGDDRKLVLLETLASELGETNPEKVYEVAKMLECQGLIHAIFTDSPRILASITGKGMVLVEQGGIAGVIPAFRRNSGDSSVSVDKSTHFHAPISNSNVAVHSQVDSQSVPLSSELSEILDRMFNQLIQDSELSRTRRHELLDGVRTIRDELQRANPSGKIVRRILAIFGDVASISGLIIQLQSYLPR